MERSQNASTYGASLGCVVVVVSDHEMRGALSAAAFACGNRISVSSVSTPDRLESLIEAEQIKPPCLLLVTDIDCIGFLNRMQALKDSPIALLVPAGSRGGTSEAGAAAGASVVLPLDEVLSEGGCERILMQVEELTLDCESLQTSRAA